MLTTEVYHPVLQIPISWWLPQWQGASLIAPWVPRAFLAQVSEGTGGWRPDSWGSMRGKSEDPRK